MKTYNGKELHKCADCVKGFINISKLNSHLELHRSRKTEMTTKTTKPTKPKKHVPAIKEEKPHECSYCGKGFKKKSLVARHTQERNHSFVTFVQSVFLQKEALRPILTKFTKVTKMTRLISVHTVERSSEAYGNFSRMSVLIQERSPMSVRSVESDSVIHQPSSVTLSSIQEKSRMCVPIVKQHSVSQDNSPNTLIAVTYKWK